MLEIFVVKIDQDLPPSTYQKLLCLVSLEKQKRIQRFRLYEDAQRTLLGDLLARFSIQSCFDLNFEDICFNITKHGKPYLVNYPHIYFNISHAGKYVVCVAGNEPAGIDVEEIKPISLDMAERFFTAAENIHIALNTENNQYTTFFDVWTKNESYAKLIGCGLTPYLRSFNTLEAEQFGTYFHKIFCNEEAVCNVCAYTAQVPNITTFSIKSFINKLHN